jgi:hypothetical protein
MHFIGNFALFSSILQFLPLLKFTEVIIFQSHCDKTVGAQFSPPLSDRFNQHSTYLQVERARRTLDCYEWMLENLKLSECSQRSSKIELLPPHRHQHKDDE